MKLNCVELKQMNRKIPGVSLGRSCKWSNQFWMDPRMDRSNTKWPWWYIICWEWDTKPMFGRIYIYIYCAYMYMYNVLGLGLTYPR